MEREPGAQVVPRDVRTGQQSGEAGAIGLVEVVVGYLVTHSDGYQVRLDRDRTRAELYAARNHATLEPMYVRRDAAPGARFGANGSPPRAENAAP